MRKIYSLVLMTALLLLGTNVWADEAPIQVANQAELLNAWYTAPNNSTIEMTDDITLGDSVLWLGTASTSDASRSLTLNLNGHVLQGTKRHMFLLSHGELTIKNTGNGGKIWHHPTRSAAEGGAEGATRKGDAFILFGSALQTVNPKEATSGYFTHLTIEENVVVDVNDGLNAIIIDCIENYLKPSATTPYVHSKKSYEFGPRPYAINYHANIFGGTDGVANGVRVDIKGTILAYKYGIKTNGYVRECTYKNAVQTTDAWAANEFAGYTLNNTYAPFIRLYSTGRIKVTDHGITDGSSDHTSQALAVYASGYARWLLEGYCGGNVGVYAKSGDIDIVNATIESTNPNSANTVGKGSGSTTQGCAIVIESTQVQSGQITVDIQGSEVSAQSGFAIEETVTKPSEQGSYTSNVTIEESNIDGGNEGAIAVSTKDGSGNYVTTVYSGTVEGDVKDESNPSTNLADVLPQDEDTHTTIVTDETGKNPVVVINPGKANSKWFATVADALLAGKDSVKLGGTAGETLITNVTLAELEINRMDSSTATPTPINQTLTIGDDTHNVVVKIGKVILGPKAKIIVKAGSQLLITGEDGIYSRNTTNLVLEANADKQATFVIGPNVSANRQPYATVDLGTKAKQVSESNYLWQRFAPPVLVTSSFTKSEAVTTYLNVVDVASETWVDVSNLNQLKVFTPAAVTNKSAMGGVVYTFTGRLVGNVVDSVKLISTKWNYFGNSYIAPMSIRDLTDTLKTQGVDATVYMWSTENQKYEQINEAAYIMALLENRPIADSIPAMEFFVVLNRVRKAGVMDINYKKSIYNYAVNPTNYRTAAPARMNANLSTLRINVESLNGEKDNVLVLEGNNYSADYENGLDAEKLMNQGMNLFVADEQNLSILASDDVIGTQLTLQTVEDVNYTFTFSGVRGEHYALRDNLTGRVVEMVEGGQYTFSAQPNETIEGRFEIVGRQEMPTAVETIETENAAKAVYTILGQYVGDASNWDALPAGIYVVDGVKIVK